MKTGRWGIFVMKDELDKMMERINNEKGLEIFEVRPLTFVEKMVYLKSNTTLFINEPHVIMFNATKLRYKTFIIKNRLKTVF